MRAASRRGTGVACAGLLLVAPLFAQEVPSTDDRSKVPATLDVEQARLALERSLAFLVEDQNEDGSWSSPVIESVWELGFALETYYAWQMASQGLAVLALIECEETPERRASLERGLDWLCTHRLPKRGDDWDVDYVWTVLYGLVALTEAREDPRFQSEEWVAKIEERGRAFYALLEHNQTPDGGWAYYDDRPYTQRPKWATSFCTALVLPTVERALALEWGSDAKVFERAKRYVEQCRLPGPTYSYDLTPIPRISGGEHINRVKGGLGRTQVCNWALSEVGDKRTTHDVVRRGLEDFFAHHRFLDVARMRPIPHEAYYANAGYFYLFGHYYAAKAINTLPAEEREAWHARLRPHLVKIQQKDGGSTDFLGTGYLMTAGTAYTALALQLGLQSES